MTPPPIPQADPRAGYLAQKADIDAAVARALEGGRYILGPEVEAFETAFAAHAGAAHAVACASGTDALVLALRAVGAGPGPNQARKGVITVSHTATATAAAIELAGAVPVLADVDAASFTLDPASLRTLLADPPLPIAAIVPVHLYGHPAAMDAIAALAAGHGVPVVEDAAQAHGAALNGRNVGSLGAAAAFSFYPTKNLAALGDGGAATTCDPALAERMAALRQYGWKQRFVAAEPGMNSRLDGLQAAVLNARLPHLDADNERRRAIARAYSEGLAGLPLGLPTEAPGARHAWHQYVVRTQHRERLRAALAERGVGTAVHYPVPVHQQGAYLGRVPMAPGGLAVTEALAAEILSLPMHPWLSDAQVERVIAEVRRALG